MADHSDHDHSDEGGNDAPIYDTKIYAGILGALLALTFASVAISFVDLDHLTALGREDEGPWNLGVALLIAAAQAGLIVLFFMRLMDDRRFYGLLFAGALATVGVLFGFTVNDTSTRGQIGDLFSGAHVDPGTGLRAPGGISGPISGEVLEDGLAVPEPDGATLFAGICAVCHTVGGGRLVGPDLAGVTRRRTEGWLIPFITSSSTVIASGDETAVALFAEFDEMPMPDVPYSEAQIRAVLAFIEAESGGAAEPEGAGEPVDDIVDDILGEDDSFGDDETFEDDEEPLPEGEGGDFIDDIMGDEGADIELEPEEVADP